jgi:phosphocarrier protein HPr
MKAAEERSTGAAVAHGAAAVEPTELNDAPRSAERAAATGSRFMTEEADEVGLEEVGPHNYRCEVVISNEQGFHMRPVMEFVALAQSFQSEINIYKGNQKVDGKDPFDVLTLEAVAGTLLVLEGRGSDATSALAALARLVRSGFPITKKPAS